MHRHDIQPFCTFKLIFVVHDRPSLFPSIKSGGGSREEITSLRSWLEGMIGRVMMGTMTGTPGASFSAASSTAVQEDLMRGLVGHNLNNGLNSAPPDALVQGALHVYGVALLELKKQVSWTWLSINSIISVCGQLSDFHSNLLLCVDIY